MKSRYYKLVDKEPVPCSMEEWVFRTPAENRKLAVTFVTGYEVSTVFLGIGHSYGDGPPLVFETMVFKLEHGGSVDCIRTSTWQQAEEAHQEMVEKYERRNRGLH